MSTRRSPHRTIPPMLPVAALAAVLVVSGCGGSAGGAGAADPQPSQSAVAGGGLPNGDGQSDGFPGADGLLAALAGSTLQVQSPQTGQVAVTYTRSTRFTKTVAATRSAVTVGSCVSVRSPSNGRSPAAVTAESVSISAPVGGSCLRRAFLGGPGGPARGGARPSGAPTGRPTGGPSGLPSGAARQVAGFRPTVGTVTAVSGSSLTTAAVAFDQARRSSGTASASPDPTPSTSPVLVTTTAATTYTRSVKATAGDLAVGQCVHAVGKADDTGAITATSISTEPAVDGGCNGGFATVRRGATGSG